MKCAGGTGALKNFLQRQFPNEFKAKEVAEYQFMDEINLKQNCLLSKFICHAALPLNTGEKLSFRAYAKALDKRSRPCCSETMARMISAMGKAHMQRKMARVSSMKRYGQLIAVQCTSSWHMTSDR